MYENIVYKYFVATDQGCREYMEDFVCTSGQPINKGNDDCDDEKSIKYFAVFDGHGGSDAAKFAQNYLFDEITKQTGFWSRDTVAVSRAISDGFISTSMSMWNFIETWPQTRGGRLSTAGTTASTVLLRDQTMYVANVGDSSVVLGKYKSCGRYTARTLTVDHKPCMEEEKQRINNEGGAVMEKAGIQRVVWKRPVSCRTRPACRSTAVEEIPFLAVSRALGDLWSYNAEKDTYIVSPKPDITVVNISEKHSFVILATDGLWQVVEPVMAVDTVTRLATNIVSSTEDAVCPAAVLVQLALDKWARRGIKADNVSVIVVLFDNFKSLTSSTLRSDYSFNMEGFYLSDDSLPLISDTPIRNPISFGHVKKQLYKARHQKNIHARKPLALISDTLNRRGSMKHRKHKFKIPVTPEQRSAYWSRRRCSKMIENLLLDYANENTGQCSIRQFCM